MFGWLKHFFDTRKTCPRCGDRFNNLELAALRQQGRRCKYASGCPMRKTGLQRFEIR
jgi:hypothetical protein